VTAILQDRPWFTAKRLYLPISSTAMEFQDYFDALMLLQSNTVFFLLA